jgi:spermidine synthase
MEDFGGRWLAEVIFPHEIHLHGIKKFFISTKSKYQSIDIAESFYFGKCLYIDGRIQSAQKDEYIYHELLVHPCLVSHPNPENVFIVGGGEGATLREVLKHNTVKSAIMVDIDEEVVELSKKYLPEWNQFAFNDKRTKLYFEDARKYLENTTQKFDVIIIDITEPLEGSPSYLLFTKEFYEIVFNRIEDDGMVSLQAATVSPMSIECHASIYKTLKEVFPIVKPYQGYIPSFDQPWGFIIASKKIDPDTLSKEEVDKRLQKRKVNDLKYYDGILHTSLFKLPKNIRESYKVCGEVIKDKKPFLLKLNV